MHLLYLDDSGLAGDDKNKHCVLAGCCVFETRTHWVEQDMDSIAKAYFPNFDVEFHGSAMRGGKGMWRRIPLQARMNAILDVLKMVSSKKGTIRIFASVVNKNNAAGIDIARHMFTQIASRFDMFLGRIYKKNKHPERGIIIFDKNKSEYQIQRMCHVFKTTGHEWGILKNLAEVPLFLDSGQSRLIQLADLIAYSIFRKFDFNDDLFYSLIKDNLDREGTIVHGMHIL